MNLFSTSLFSVLWFSVFSGSTINFTLIKADSDMVETFSSGIENTIYQFFENMPGTGLLTVLFLEAVFLSFVTAAAIKVLFRPDLYRDSAEKSKKESPSD